MWIYFEENTGTWEVVLKGGGSAALRSCRRCHSPINHKEREFRRVTGRVVMNNKSKMAVWIGKRSGFGRWVEVLKTSNLPRSQRSKVRGSRSRWGGGGTCETCNCCLVYNAINYAVGSASGHSGTTKFNSKDRFSLKNGTSAVRVSLPFWVTGFSRIILMNWVNQLG